MKKFNFEVNWDDILTYVVIGSLIVFLVSGMIFAYFSFNWHDIVIDSDGQIVDNYHDIVLFVRKTLEIVIFSIVLFSISATGFILRLKYKLKSKGGQ